MKDIYILANAQNPIVADAKAANEVELIMPVVHQVFKQTGFTQNDIGFTCSGSCDYLQGAALHLLRVCQPFKLIHRLKNHMLKWMQHGLYMNPF